MLIRRYSWGAGTHCSPHWGGKQGIVTCSQSNQYSLIFPSPPLYFPCPGPVFLKGTWSQQSPHWESRKKRREPFPSFSLLFLSFSPFFALITVYSTLLHFLELYHISSVSISIFNSFPTLSYPFISISLLFKELHKMEPQNTKYQQVAW
jgi:hypothetical protein